LLHLANYRRRWELMIIGVIGVGADLACISVRLQHTDLVVARQRNERFARQTFATGAALWCNALTSDEGLGLITPQVANRSGLRH
jgi:hypothetical protein